MAQQPGGRFRRFLQTTPGKVLLIVLAVVMVFATYAFVLVLLATVVFLIFGLAIPIWSGLKRPRFLFLLGVIVILAVAPISNIFFTQEISTPLAPVSSIGGTVDGTVFSIGGPLMQNASVDPYQGSAKTNFTWTVTVYPQDRPHGNTTPVEIDLYISTCPGATGPSSPNCAAGYPLFVLENKTLPSNQNLTKYTVRFHYQIGSNGIWSWQMGIWTHNTSTNKPFFQLLNGDPTYNGIEGPVIGGFGATYLALLGEIYFQDALFLAVPFLVLLLVYMVFKNREKRRKEAQQRAPGPVPSTPTAPAGTPAPGGPGGAPLPSSGGAGGSGTTSVAAADELNCPKCNAVIYKGETTCWKCGATLPATPSSSTGNG